MIPCQSPSFHFLRNFSVTFIIVPLLSCFLLLFPALFPQAHKRKSFLSASHEKSDSFRISQFFPSTNMHEIIIIMEISTESEQMKK